MVVLHDRAVDGAAKALASICGVPTAPGRFQVGALEWFEIGTVMVALHNDRMIPEYR